MAEGAPPRLGAGGVPSQPLAEGAHLAVPFADRAAAGRALAEQVARQGGLEEPVVVALARGGVVVGAEVARALGAPLYAMPVAKVGAPGQEELAVGAVAPGGVTVLNDDVVSLLGLLPAEVEALVQKAAVKVAAQQRTYDEHGAGEIPSLRGRSAVVVDDGLATGATMRAALLATHRRRPARLVMAVPVAPPESLAALADLVDGYVCLLEPRHMRAVGAWYEDFTQTTDAEVQELLAELGPNGG
jgi:predicted phosphoribosyltransferase